MLGAGLQGRCTRVEVLDRGKLVRHGAGLLIGMEKSKETMKSLGARSIELRVAVVGGLWNVWQLNEQLSTVLGLMMREGRRAALGFVAPQINAPTSDAFRCHQTFVTFVTLANMAYADDAVRAKLSALNETQDSIVSVAQWIIFHRFACFAPASIHMA